MTSGFTAAIASASMPEASDHCTGFWAPSVSASFASNQSVDFSAFPPNSTAATPTGTTPRARATSWFTQDTVATRAGRCGISVVP